MLLWVKSSVSIKFKLSAETVPVFKISSAKFVNSIVTLSASIVAESLFTKSSPAVTLKLSALIFEEFLFIKSPSAVTLN